jgi:hypothetical protein
MKEKERILKAARVNDMEWNFNTPSSKLLSGSLISWKD